MAEPELVGGGGIGQGAVDAAVATHTGDSSAHAASAVSFSPTGTIAATDVQAAVAEVATDAATSLTSTLDGLKIKPPVRAVATSNITLSGTQTIDGVAVEVGDRVLAAGQSTLTNRRVWVVASGAWTAATDTDSNAELVDATVLVLQGTAHGGDIYRQETLLGDLAGDGPLWSVVNKNAVTAALLGVASTFTARQTFSAGASVTSTNDGTNEIPALRVGAALGLDLANADTHLHIASAANNAVLIVGKDATNLAFVEYNGGTGKAAFGSIGAAVPTLLGPNGEALTIGTAASTLGLYGATPAARPAAITNASTTHALNVVFTDTEVEAALNALGTKINSVLAALRTTGLIAT